ncbi:mCG146905, partial [Mus musculus]
MCLGVCSDQLSGCSHSLHLICKDDGLHIHLSAILTKEFNKTSCSK